MLSKRTYKWIAIVAFAGLGVNSAATAKLYDDRANEAVARDEANRITSIRNCHNIGDPLLHATIHSNKQEIERTRAALQRAKLIDLHAVARRLGVPLEQLRQSQQDQRETITTDQAILRPLLAAPSCEERYPPLP